MKTLADILRESREQAQKTVDVIDKLIAESKEAGTQWPEVEVRGWPDLNEHEVSLFNDVE